MRAGWPVRGCLGMAEASGGGDQGVGATSGLKTPPGTDGAAGVAGLGLRPKQRGQVAGQFGTVGLDRAYQGDGLVVVVPGVVQLESVCRDGVGGGDPGVHAECHIRVADLSSVIGKVHDLVGVSKELQGLGARPAA